MGDQTPEQQMLACIEAMNAAHAAGAETVTLRMDGLRVFVNSFTRIAARLLSIEIAAKEFVEIEETYGMLEMNRWDDAFDALRKALEAGK
jgi:ribonuclease HI